MARRAASLGVDWHLPDGKGGYRARRFATTTKASSDLIAMLAADGLTWAQVRDGINFDDEAKAVAEHFIAAGYGDTRAMDHVA